MSFSFNDGGGYEDFMGAWSRKVGEQFLDWLAPATGLAWVDIGCGNGCSTEQLCQRTAPHAVEAIDPSPEQLAHARELLRDRPVNLQQGDAMALPFAERSFDAAQMGLVISLLPDPARGVAEMVRVTRPGGLVAAYTWAVLAGGQPYESVWQAQGRLGIPVMQPRNAQVSDPDALGALWRGAGLAGVETRRIQVTRDFPNMTAFWASCLKGPLFAQTPPDRLDEVREETRKLLGCAETGEPIAITAFASAVKGRVPG